MALVNKSTGQTAKEIISSPEHGNSLEKLVEQQTETIESLKSENENLQTQVTRLLNLNKTKDLSKQEKELIALKNQNVKLNISIKDSQDKQLRAEQERDKAYKDRDYAIHNQRTVTQYRDRVKTEYREKCTNCSKEQIEKVKLAYETRKHGLTIFTIGFGLYSALCTILTAIRSDVVFCDIRSFFVGIGEIFAFLFKMSRNGILGCSSIALKIQNPIGSTICHWLIIIALTIILIALIGGGILFLVNKIGEVISDSNAIDLGFLLVSVISLALIVFLGDLIKPGLKINLVWLWIIILIAYLVGRIYYESVKEDSHALIVAVVVVIIAFGFLYGASRFVIYNIEYNSSNDAEQITEIN